MAQALGQIAETRTTARGLIVNLPDILFDTGKSTLRPEAREVISRIAGVLMIAQGITLKIEGHTDSVGGDEYNQKLSEQRAGSVKEYLEKAGVKAELITTQGFGKTQPIADNTTAAGRQKNRRVEIVISDQPGVKP
jgi:outer membrane protein OmpA-like peptidoglycan-associated protein